VNRYIALVPLIFAAAPSMAQQSLAQQSNWSYTATIYAWFPDISTKLDTFNFGTVQSDIPAKDVLSALDMAFFGAFTAQNGPMGFAGDVVYSDLSRSKAKPGPLFGDGTIATQLTTVSGYGLYRVTSDPQVDVDLGAGLRYINLEGTASLSSGLVGGVSESVGGDWVDPLVAARVSVKLNDQWRLKGFADLGGTGSGDESWQFYGGATYSINDRWSTDIGYRYMEINNDLKGRDISVDLSGPLVGFTFSF